MKQTLRTPRYKLHVERTTTSRSRLMEMLELDVLAFNTIELETGIAFLDDYFDIALSGKMTNRIESYKLALLTDARHVYWPWFINQKRQMEEQLHREFDSMECLDLHWLRGEYDLEISCFVRDSRLHNKFRHFLTQSATLYV